MLTPIPAAEMPAVIAATKEGRCVSCYGPVSDGHTFYCHACDDGCSPECRRNTTATMPDEHHPWLWVNQCNICGLDSGPWRNRRRARWSGMKHVKRHHPDRLRRRSRWL